MTLLVDVLRHAGRCGPSLQLEIGPPGQRWTHFKLKRRNLQRLSLIYPPGLEKMLNPLMKYQINTRGSIHIQLMAEY